MANPGSSPQTISTVLTRVYLSLGSNLGDGEALLRAAIGKLSSLGEVTKCSSLYQTEPVEFTYQPDFLNCAVELKTGLSPQQVLEGVLAIERAMGRERAAQPAKGPRSIDIDLLLAGDAVIDSNELVLPHAAMHLRRFVLEPLAEIAPEAKHPRLRQTVRELLEGLPEGPAVRKLPG